LRTNAAAEADVEVIENLVKLTEKPVELKKKLVEATENHAVEVARVVVVAASVVEEAREVNAERDPKEVRGHPKKTLRKGDRPKEIAGRLEENLATQRLLLAKIALNPQP
jgi:hypothetical protein